MNWVLAPEIPVALRGGFGGFVVRNTETGELGYFKVRKYQFDAACINLAKLAGITTPEFIEFNTIDNKQGGVIRFWGPKSFDAVQYEKQHGKLAPELHQVTGFLAFISWVGYGDLRNEHLLWANQKVALIDFDDCFSWRYEKFRHLFGPSMLLQTFNPEALRMTVEKIQGIPRDAIYEAFTSMAPLKYRFRPVDEARFTNKLYNDAQKMHENLGRYWQKGIVDRNIHLQLNAQDIKLWRNQSYRIQVENCAHHWMDKEQGLKQCQDCQFWWPLQGDPE